ncbi:hypothetical protein DPSP01_006252 [Paraphaeosphaeria sporulosa]|uniref:Uncharacterized protein n=1 Tax=Paraphaeosphaeria sporulosa TaxID=1460663 RepID=A0A177BZ49_9PLEO|nr:uncharacterized protein CC84DRAFT_1168884 [Paraphaeosphaeria sporulosa]OAF99978.1 hypothetical protein CC84DRAFT_1168884 [Paraphaeosphaeria sporulosa]
MPKADTGTRSTASPLFSASWLDGTLARRVRPNGSFKTNEANIRNGTVFGFWGQRMGYVHNQQFRTSRHFRFGTPSKLGVW